MTFRHRGIFAVALATGALWLSVASHAQVQTPTPSKPDIVEDGLVKVLLPQFRGLPVFDQRRAVAGYGEFETQRWLMLQQLTVNRDLLNNRRSAARYALMFLPSSTLDRYFDCVPTVKGGICSQQYAGTTAYGRANSQELQPYARFKGNEFDSARLHQDFVQTYGDRMVRAAGELPREAYLIGKFSFLPFSDKDGGFPVLSQNPFSSGQGVGSGADQVVLGDKFCAPSNVAFPKVLRMERPAAEEIVQKIDSNKSSPALGSTIRSAALVMKVRIDKVAMVTTTCNSSVEPLALELHQRDSLEKALMVLPIERAALAAPTPPPASTPRQAVAVSTPPPPPAPKSPGLSSPGSEPLARAKPERVEPKSPDPSAGPDIIGIRLAMPMAQAEKIVRDYMTPDLVYELGIEGESTGYPKGLAMVSLKQGEAIFLYTGDATPGLVSGVERTVIADAIDVAAVRASYKNRYVRPGGHPGIGRSTGPVCGVAFSSRVNKPTTRLVSGRAPSDAESVRTLERLMAAGRHLHAGQKREDVGGSRASCGPGIYLNTVTGSNPMLSFTLWDHSRASFDSPEVVAPKRGLKL